MQNEKMEKKLGLLRVAKEKYMRKLMLLPPIWTLGMIAIRIKQEALKKIAWL